ncbi:MAG: class I SAM-dependent methyltransferase, partial [Deltaproteobacteria bacterium]|nr:class I SAM-dependent methyltransferase [Deltaproteobacteria bacterium]
MTENMSVSLKDLPKVAETLLYPLLSRYSESVKENGILNDPKAVEIVEALDYDVANTRLFNTSRLGACLRSLIIDEQVERFLALNPDGVVINIGCGLDTRFPRFDNGTVEWYDLDLPETIEVRRHFFDESERYHFIARSALDTGWVGDVRQGRKTMCIMEGLSFYFTEEQNRSLLKLIHDTFPGAQLLMECFHPFFIKMCTLPLSKDKLDKSAASQLKWGVKSGKYLERWFEGIRFVEEWYVVDRGRHYFPLGNRLMFRCM